MSIDKLIDAYIRQSIYAAIADRRMDSDNDNWKGDVVESYENLMQPNPQERIDRIKFSTDIRKMTMYVWRRILGEVKLVEIDDDEFVETAQIAAEDAQGFSIIRFITDEIRMKFGPALADHPDAANCFATMYQSAYTGDELMIKRKDKVVELIHKFIKFVAHGLMLIAWYNPKTADKYAFINVLSLRGADAAICDALLQDDIDAREAIAAAKAEKAAAKELADATKAAAKAVKEGKKPGAKTGGGKKSTATKKPAADKKPTPPKKNKTPPPADDDDTEEDDDFADDI